MSDTLESELPTSEKNECAICVNDVNVSKMEKMCYHGVRNMFK